MLPVPKAIMNEYFAKTAAVLPESYFSEYNIIEKGSILWAKMVDTTILQTTSCSEKK